MARTAAVRVPDGAKPIRELLPGEVMCDKAGWWYVRPPGGYLQHLNRDEHPVVVHEGARGKPEEEDPVSVSGVIAQRGGGRYLLVAGVWDDDVPGAPESEPE